MCLVLKLQQPALHNTVNIDVYEDAASVILLALLHIVELTELAEVARTDSSQLHKAEALLLATKLLADTVHKLD